MTSDEMRGLHVSAPGKLILMGEYCVLEGAPALVSAVDRRLRVSSLPGKGFGTLHYHLDLPSRCELDLDLSDPQELERQSPFLHAVLATAAGGAWGRLEQLGGETIVCESADFYDHSSQGLAVGTKLGLGSSAASCVALMAIIRHRLGEVDDSRSLFELSLKAHRDFQLGRGSGADVAAATYGGLLAYRLDGWEKPAVEPLHWPSELHWAAYWLGEPANTRSFLKSYEALRSKDQARGEALMGALTAASVQAYDSIRDGDAGRFLEAVRHAEAGLEALGQAIAAPIVTPAHRELSQVAARAGAAAKPSGAGGGDFSLVFAHSADTLRNVAQSLPRSVRAFEFRAESSGMQFFSSPSDIPVGR
ncbi:MAG: hypothetical protein AUK47_10565 [Deltaproteobacteria bacterium CG2_30_63_29]|nr:MAG: hypothetical protein AUK47_10565 [Deltaproteobacteria bacterium CG2_30_63_29]PJB48970.1 MAG: hypothetical protein CO108_01340 [Deltaproteobacteria bacterium CG_4_9_14_3_um_filter_63_12]